jgi:hypothetical protein
LADNAPLRNSYFYYKWPFLVKGRAAGYILKKGESGRED